MIASLPDGPFVEPGIRKGRVPKEGYQRGWGLQFGKLRDIVEGEQLFKKAAEAGAALSQWTALEKRTNIYLLLTRFVPRLADQNVIEFGAFKGGTSVFMATVLQEMAPNAKVYALDTFGGMPPTDKAVDAHNTGDFSTASLDFLNEQIRLRQLTNLVPVKGLFQETFPCLPTGLRFGLCAY